MKPGWPRLLVSMLPMIVATAAIACGPSLAQQEAAKACREQCGMELAGCYESRTCLAIDGQIVPCEEECQQENDSCEASCQEQ